MILYRIFFTNKLFSISNVYKQQVVTLEVCLVNFHLFENIQKEVFILDQRFLSLSLLTMFIQTRFYYTLSFSSFK